MLSISAMTSSVLLLPYRQRTSPCALSNVMPTGRVLRIPRLSSERLVAAVCAQSRVPLRYRLKHICRRYYGICCEALHRHTAAGTIDYRIGKIGGILKRSAAGTPCTLIWLYVLPLAILPVLPVSPHPLRSAAAITSTSAKRDYLFAFFMSFFPFNCLSGQTVSYFSSAVYMLIRYHICLNYKTCDSLF